VAAGKSLAGVAPPLSYLVSLRLSAKQDVAEAEDWYEEREPGLGVRFRTEVFDAIARISENPFLYPDLFKGNRRCVLRRFPYNIWFRVIGSEVVIMAIIHGKRGPRLVRGQLNSE
jgi:plasmid stabilization system protein ParE